MALLLCVARDHGLANDIMWQSLGNFLKRQLVTNCPLSTVLRRSCCGNWKEVGGEGTLDHEVTQGRDRRSPRLSQL